MDDTENAVGPPRTPAASRSRTTVPGRCFAAVWLLLSRMWFVVFCAVVTALWAWSFLLADGVDTGWPVLGSVVATVSVLPGALLLFLQIRSQREARRGPAAVPVSLTDLLTDPDRRAAAWEGCSGELRALLCRIREAAPPPLRLDRAGRGRA